jgi:hypothetical protein
MEAIMHHTSGGMVICQQPLHVKSAATIIGLLQLFVFLANLYITHDNFKS